MKSNTYAAKFAKTREADAAHEVMMNFFAKALGCSRSRVSGVMYDTPKDRLVAIMEEFEGQREAA